MTTRSLAVASGLILLAAAWIGCGGEDRTTVRLLNVSYDPTREFYKEFGQSFADYWRQQTGQQVVIEQSHGGSGKQARAVIDGLEADVVTLASAYDIDAIASARPELLAADWRSQLPNGSAPYTSTIVFLVRRGNPLGIRDWSDLTNGRTQVVMPNPKTSGGARWIILAAWGYVLWQEFGPDWDGLDDPERLAAAEAKAEAFVTELVKRVPVLDSGARGSTNTFLQRGIGDVLLTWENEAHLAIAEAGSDQVEIVVPSVSILAEPPVALIGGVAEKHGTTEVARAYLEHLYSPRGQQLAAQYHFRPSQPETLSEAERAKFEQLELFTIDRVFGGWTAAQRRHFDDGGTFDRIYRPEGAAP